MNILLVHGPNLNLLGKRQPEIYGTQTLDNINHYLIQVAQKQGVELKTFQSNHEGAIVSEIGDNIDWADGILINPAAYTHTSVAIRDALSAVTLPVIEIHLSNIYKREGFRHHSYVSPIAVGVISGFGSHSYELALNAMINILQQIEKENTG
ncbi:TPA: type II 3-dehydroquinate dehydratase [Candidatus Poribacteria bacterium]|jgi:3-dehydroquinate dehydratase-2|nr:type II 3-dehydroquinate dehydratase [Candidatus Poribacteria bacterium]HIA64952.1 type II 3-dehydroquinate dehydratase [Candidatus Poribacteria bacterium]HIB87759.1 type II 3-dehydroquinate dehydratase [Candidatus Poribacteria bacterium]HIC02358.1 type II 3-dehydroquinate dehydratase [Candidatus Poribacteria bacterium]HIN28467.1 type II 3-dehydroquinate dehydratase [Candidatus Poribacteria bacterium]